mmetsp:Transcript_21986/g.39910  ORF Transcript_21986/g.39910 Transcript_21986/m.39910 type:complete len:537 (-) Transcript_21986:67-1677(-)
MGPPTDLPSEPLDARAEAYTDAGFPNPHARAVLPKTSGPPMVFGPPARIAEVKEKSDAGDASSSKVLHENTRVDDQVEQKDERTAEDDTDEEESGETDEDGDEESEAEGRTLEDFLAMVTPAAQCFPVTLAQSTERQRVLERAGKWVDVKGLRLMVKPANEDDCILLVANCFVTPEIDLQESQWAIQCAGHELSPRFAAYSRQKGWSHYVCMPFLHQPGKRMEYDYQVATSLGGTGTSCVVSPERQRRNFFAVTFPAFQCLWVEDDDKQAIESGLWQDVQGFAEVITTLPGDKVLCICSLRYNAEWSSEMNRGRFTIVRDDVGLDTLADRGLQSVRALAPKLKRMALMATIDEPPPGPHLYRVRAALTVGEEQGAVNMLEGTRQLALIRLPGHIVSGPCRAEGPVQIEEGTWSEIPGLSATITLRRPRDKVLIVYHCDCHPQDYHYEGHFTVFRRSEAGSVKNLGFSDDFGMEMVSSDYRASSECPTGLLCDSPGGLGPWTYYIAARVANVGTSSENPPVVTGYAGTISAVLLASR